MHRFTREQLYELVWSEPMRHVAERLGISDVGLAKTCRRANVPVPERGYWAKRQAGRAPTQAPLPPRGFGMSRDVRIGTQDSRPGRAHAEDLPEEPQPSSFPEPMDEVIARARALVGNVLMSKTLSTPHALIEKVLGRDDERRKNQLTSSLTAILDPPLFESKAEQRRLRILNALFVAWERCGATPSLRGRDARQPGVRVGDVHVTFKLDFYESPVERHERRSRVGNSASEYLKLAIESWWPGMPPLPSWEDTEKTRLEDHLSEIASQALVSAEMLLRFGSRQMFEYEVKERARRIEAARVKLEEQERERLAQLERARQQRLEMLRDETCRWRRAADIRAYVHAAVEAESSAQNARAEELNQWAAWALQEADRLDPLCADSPNHRRSCVAEGDIQHEAQLNS
jgi:hypothetical protein